MTPYQVNLYRLLDRLSPYQKAVAAWRPENGNLKVDAVAGSGKTTTICALTATLITLDVLKPEKLVVTTYSNKAGLELNNRLARLLPPHVLAKAQIGTFHSLALRAVRSTATKWNLSRCVDVGADTRSADVPASWLIWKGICSPRKLVPGLKTRGMKFKVLPAQVQRAVGLLRAHNFNDASEVSELEATQITGLAGVRRAWEVYQEAKAALNVWDFDDVLAEYLNQLEAGKHNAGTLTVIVDEAQDNNKVQLAIAQAMAGNHGRIILVGQRAQTVHAWRGAYPELFEKAEEVVGADTSQLPVCYRSKDEIIELANRVLPALGEETQTEGIRGPGAVIYEISGDEPLEAAEEVAREIAERIQRSAKPDDFAILSRTNAGLINFSAALTRANVPNYKRGGDSLFATREAQTVLAYCALIDKDDPVAVTAIANRPSRYLTAKTIGELAKGLRGGGQFEAEIALLKRRVNGSQAQGLDNLARTIRQLRKAIWKRAPFILKHVLAPEMLQKKEEEGPITAPDEDRPATYAALLGIASRFESAADFVKFCNKCVDSARDKEAKGKVTLSTIHGVKGLEWKNVYVESTENHLPHYLSLESGARWEDESVQDELRLFYVAITRAEDELTFCWSKKPLSSKASKGGMSRFARRFWLGEKDSEGNY